MRTLTQVTAIIFCFIGVFGWLCWLCWRLLMGRERIEENLQLWIVMECSGEERTRVSGGKIVGIFPDPRLATQLEAEEPAARWIETWKLTDLPNECKSKKIWVSADGA